MILPPAFLQSLQGLPGFDNDAFVAAHERPAPTSVRLNPLKWTTKMVAPPDAPQSATVTVNPQQKVPWAEAGYYLLQRPSFTFDPFFHAGCYYVQEASSMFLEQPVKQLVDLTKPLKVLDLCASPGGKSTHLLSLLSADSLLVSNEVIKPRSVVLTDNIIRWGAPNVVVSHTDPRSFGRLPPFFDLMVVDAPCSGSGLFRKDAAAMEEWSLHNVALCSQRQQRILADALPCLKEGGVLVYSTCSYAREEDEGVMDWLLKEMAMEPLPLDVSAFAGIAESRTATGAVGYRFYPDKIEGEGFFLACFRQQKAGAKTNYKAPKPPALPAKEQAAVAPFMDLAGQTVLPWRSGLVALPQAVLSDVLYLNTLLPLPYVGVAVGEVMKDRLVPHHALAQSRLLAANVPAFELSYAEAIRYLQRGEMTVPPPVTGWQVVRYGGQALGWINALPNRINNYYPKEIRILKTRNENAFEK